MNFRLFLKRMSALIACVIAITGLSQYTTSISATASAIPEFIFISAGDSFAIALAKDGSVWSWGENAYGQLGDNTRTNRSTPQKIKELSGIVKIACGEFHAIALKKDGTVWTWGNNDLGQLGNGSVDRNTKLPRMVKGLKDIVAIAGGSKQSFALTKDGTVWGWGNNYMGQLALDDINYTNCPTIITNLPKLEYITSKFEFTMGISKEGKVYAWGDFYMDITDSPIKELEISNVKEICTLRCEAILLLTDGTVWRMETRHGTIEQLKDLSDIKQISGGSAHFIALKKDGTVWSCGALFSTTSIMVVLRTNCSQVQKVDSIKNVTFVASGSNSAYCIDKKNKVYAWGNNSYGQLGLSTIIQKNVPTKVNTLSDVQKVATHESYSIALKKDGTVWEWAQYDDEGIVKNKGLPVNKTGIPNVNTISCSDSNGSIIDDNGRLWTWGVNINDGNMPEVFNFSGYDVKELSGTSLDEFTILMSDGTVWAFQSSRGTDSLFRIPNLPKITNISSSYSGKLGLAEDGSVWEFDYSILGDSIDYDMTKKVNSLSNIVAISSGGEFNAALNRDGSVLTWGKNSSGQLGNGTFLKSDTPTKVKTLTNISQISCGAGYCLALKKDGTVWAWGANSYGQLGDGTLINRSSPIQVKGLKNITQIATGYEHSLVVDSSGDVYSWGSNGNGQLGLGINPFIRKPTDINFK